MEKIQTIIKLSLFNLMKYPQGKKYYTSILLFYILSMTQNFKMMDLSGKIH